MNQTKNSTTNWIFIAIVSIISVFGVMNTVINKRALDAMPELLPIVERDRLINIIESNKTRIDSLCDVIDTLRHEHRIQNIRIKKASKPRTIIIHDTLKVE